MLSVQPLAMSPLPSVAAKGGNNPLTLERIFDDPDLSGSSPRAHKLSPDGTRATFLLGREKDAYQTDLWEYNIETDSINMLVNSTLLFGDREEEVSEDEQGRRERARMATAKGILSYSYSHDGQKILFPLAGELYIYHTANGEVKKLTGDGRFATDPSFSPQGRYVSYICDRNLYVTEVATGITKQLTAEGGGAIGWGVAEFVAQEELGRMTGYWWGPDDDHLVVARIDETLVPLARRCEIHQSQAKFVEQRYPAAGDSNVLVKLALLSASGKSCMKWLDLGDDDDIYLARVDWLPDATGVLVQRLSRNQHTLDVLLYRLSDSDVLTPVVIITEESQTWVNVHSSLRPLQGGHIIWASEKTGYRHLYYHTANGKIHALTSGDWVVDEIVGINQSLGLVYFTGNKDSPLEQHLYSVDMGRGHVTRLTQAAGWHDIVFNKDGTVYFDTWSDTCTPPQVTLHRADGTLIKTLSANAVVEGHPLYPYIGQLALPEYGTIAAADGTTLHYQLLRPTCQVAGRQYPVHLRVYGGPHSQQVQRRWGGRGFLVDSYMAQQGFVVFTLDNRGSARRGKVFEEPLHKGFGCVEVDDQLAGVAFLKTLGYVDPARIGVFGWSYGGFMTLMLLSKAGDQFACGVAVAPVTDWRLYDTAYTERYIGHPRDNEKYRQSSVLTHLDGLPSHKLLLIHGMADDNVLFANSTKVMDALQQRNCRFRLMTYPGERHAIANARPRLHVWSEITGMFMEKVRDKQQCTQT